MQYGQDHRRFALMSITAFLCMIMCCGQGLAVGLESSSPQEAESTVYIGGKRVLATDYLRIWLSDDRLKATPCGPACMAMALEIMDVPFTGKELSSLANKDGSTDFATLYDCARSKGIYAEAVRILPQY